MRVTWDKFGNVLTGIQGGHNMGLQCDSSEVDGRESIEVWFRDAQNKVVKRAKKTLTATLPYMLLGSADVSVISGFTAPAILLVNDTQVNVTGTQYLLQNRSQGMYRIELKGNQLANPIFIAVLTLEELTTQVRAERDQRLRDSDWTQLPDSPLAPETKLAWRDYRQQLRDMFNATLTSGAFEWPPIPV